MASQQLLTMKSIQSIFSKRTTVPTIKADGPKLVFTVQGEGTTIDVTDKAGEFVLDQDGVVLQKTIFNVRANSELALKNPLNIALLRDAIKAEKLGKAQEAHDLYNQYLNKVQISFSVFTNSAVATKITNGVEIEARVQLITTDNGQLLTIDPSTITIKAAEFLRASTFDLEALTGMSEEELAAPVAEETKKPAGKGAGKKASAV